MAFFKKRKPSEEGSLFDSGRRLYSERALTECLTDLEASILSDCPPEGAHRSAYVIPGWRWHGALEASPQAVVAFHDKNRDFLLAAFWPERVGTTCVFFSLGSGDERLLSMPVLDTWHARDPSVRSVGVSPGGQISLVPPHISDQFFEEILTTAKFPTTLLNQEMLGHKIGEMFLVKAFEFISTYDQPGAERFVQNHVNVGGPAQAFCQRILDDLAAWNPDVLPYIQDMPMRCRAILLTFSDAPIWDELEQASLSYERSVPGVDMSQDQPDAWIKTGLVYMKNGRYAEAAAAYDRALALDESHIDAWNNKGIMFVRLGHTEQALATFSHVLTLDPYHVDAWNNKGVILRALGQIQEADFAMQRARELRSQA